MKSLLILAFVLSGCSSDSTVAGSNTKTGKEAKKETKEAETKADSPPTGGGGSTSGGSTSGGSTGGGASGKTTANGGGGGATAASAYVFSAHQPKDDPSPGGVDTFFKKTAETSVAAGEFVYFAVSDGDVLSTAKPLPAVSAQGVTVSCTKGGEAKEGLLAPIACEKLESGALLDAFKDKNFFCFTAANATAVCDVRFKADAGDDLGAVKVTIAGTGAADFAPVVPDDAPTTVPATTATQKVCNATVGYIFPEGATSEADAAAKAMSLQNPGDDCHKIGCQEASRQVNFCDDSQAGAVGDGKYLCAIQYQCKN